MSQFWTPEEIAGGATEPLLYAEQGLLGAILYDQAALFAVEGLVAPESFLEPTHGEIYARCVEASAKGERPEVTAIARQLENHKGLGELGGLRYLADLIDRAGPASGAAALARIIRDGDQRRQIEALSRGLGRAVKESQDVELETILGNFEEQLLEITSQEKEVEVVGAAAAVDAVFDGLRNPDKRRAIKTGLAPLDRALGGLTPGHLILLAGRPSMGKSALSSTIARLVAQHDVWPDGSRVGVLEISAEIDVEQMTRRHITDLALDLSPRDAPSYFSLKEGEGLTADGLTLAEHAGRQIAALDNLRMIYRPGLTVPALRGLIRRQAARWKRQGIRLGLVIVDHVGLMRDHNRNSGRYEAQTNLAIEMKELAGQVGVALLALAQLSRQIETRDNKRPVLNDLRDSGAWEENADAVIGIYRDAYYAAREPEPKKHDEKHLWEMRKISQSIEAILLKVREGKAGMVELWGDMPRNAIRAARPDNYHDSSGAGYLFASNALDPDRKIEAPIPNAGAKAEKPAPNSVRAPRKPDGSIDLSGLTPPTDGPPEPPLEAYDADEFA